MHCTKTTFDERWRRRRRLTDETGGRGPEGKACREGVSHDGQPNAGAAKGGGDRTEEEGHGTPPAAVGGGESPPAGEAGEMHYRTFW